jgi:pyruvate/2-oxoglutarate/acetoin dehydrogenase E1 component
MNAGGLRVAVPATPADAKGLLKEAIRGNVPSFFLEATGRGGEMGEVPDEDYTTPFGVASVVDEGEDVTLITMGTMLKPTIAASKTLSEQGIRAEILDCRTLVPLDVDSIIRSVEKTGRVVVMDEARDSCSAASQIAAVIADKAFHALKAPVKRVTVPDVSMPYAPNAEHAVIPDAKDIVDTVQALLSK